MSAASIDTNLKVNPETRLLIKGGAYVVQWRPVAWQWQPHGGGVIHMGCVQRQIERQLAHKLVVHSSSIGQLHVGSTCTHRDNT